MISIPRAVVYVDLGAVEDNYRTIEGRLSTGVTILCVVKADAYGHGAAEVSHRLERLGVGCLGVATMDEGIELRDHNIRAPILVMSGVMPWDDTETLQQHDLVPVVYDLVGLKRLREEAGSFVLPLRIHLKFDTGMGRLGFMPDDAPYVLDLLKSTGNLAVEGLMSHFSSSEIRDNYGMEQVAAFSSVVEFFRRNGVTPRLVHMANSGAITTYPEAHFNMVRAGISLYGSHSGPPLKEKLPTKQVMKFVSRIALIREIPAGYALSYGRAFTTEKITKVAYVPVGYADGYPRALSNRGAVLIKDKRCPIVGRICMDWLLADISGVEDVEVEEEVILLGQSNREIVTADEIGEIAGTIPYEILCKISKRVLRVYV
jgi:alanine racemase